VRGWLPRRDHSGTKCERLALGLGLRDLEQGALVVLEAGRPSRFLRLRRDGANFESAVGLAVADTELSSSSTDPAFRTAAADFCPNLGRNCFGRFGLLFLSEPDPLGNLLVPLQRREVGP